MSKILEPEPLYQFNGRKIFSCLKNITELLQKIGHVKFVQNSISTVRLGVIFGGKTVVWAYRYQTRLYVLTFSWRIIFDAVQSDWL
jgi:hypothetical protein